MRITILILLAFTTVACTSPGTQPQADTSIESSSDSDTSNKPASQDTVKSGWVDVEFDITVKGNVENPVIVASQPPGVFDKPALKALKKWKFNPKIVDGQPVRQRSKQRIEFKMD